MRLILDAHKTYVYKAVVYRNDHPVEHTDELAALMTEDGTPVFAEVDETPEEDAPAVVKAKAVRTTTVRLGKAVSKSAETPPAGQGGGKGGTDLKSLTV